MRQGRAASMILAAYFGACAVSGSQVSGSPVPHVRAPQGFALMDLTRVGEDALIVESIQSPPLEISPASGDEKLELLTRSATGIVVIDVVSIAGEFTHRPDSITSHVTASLVDIAKAPKEWSRRIGDLVTFDLDGGEAYVAGTKVQVVVSWAPRTVEVGKRYLVFGHIVGQPELRLRAGPTGIYEMTGSGGFRRLATVSSPDDIETGDQTSVLIRIRDAVQ